MKELIRQSYDTFNIYGRPPETLETLIINFSLALKGESLDDINQAFFDWNKYKKQMPVPADIFEMVQEIKKQREILNAPRVKNMRRETEEEKIETKNIPEWRRCETKWEDWNESVRAEFINFHKDWDRAIFKHLVTIYGISVEDFNAECEKRSKAVNITV